MCQVFESKLLILSKRCLWWVCEKCRRSVWKIPMGIIFDRRKWVGKLFSLYNLTIVFINKCLNNEKDDEVEKKNDDGRHSMSFYVWNFLFPFFKWLSHCHVIDLIFRYIPSETILKPAQFSLLCHRCDRSQIICVFVLL